MKKLFLSILIAFSSALVGNSELNAQTRIAFLPFENMDGNMQLNVWCYDLRDSLMNSIQALDPDNKHLDIVPTEEVEMTIAELNLDPTNPQYKSDVWKAMKMLKVKKVVTGNFIFDKGKFLINAYIIDVKMKLHDPANQARDIFKSEDKIFDAIPLIVDALKGGLIKS